MKTDDELRADVEAELNWDPSVDNDGIVVSVKDGVVTLAGRVPAYTHRWAAERATKNVAGVRAIANDIEVKPSAAESRSDKDIAEAAAAALKSNVSVPAERIKVIVRDGWVTLEGQVEFWFQKDAAERAVRELWGVKGISNLIELGAPPVRTEDVTREIHRSFKRHADLDADRVQVDVEGDTVTLRGEVHSWHELEDAETAAWSAPGVRDVRNELTVSM